MPKNVQINHSKLEPYKREVEKHILEQKQALKQILMNLKQKLHEESTELMMKSSQYFEQNMEELSKRKFLVLNFWVLTHM